MSFIRFFNIKNSGFKRLVWPVIAFHLLWATPAGPAYAAIFTGGSGKGDASLEGSAASTPAKLAFTIQPGVTNSNQLFDPQPVVEIQDRNGNVVDPSTECTVALAILNNPVNGTLGGTTSMTSVAGVADFSGMGLFVDKSGQLYTLRATASGGSRTDVTAAVSASFDVLVNEFQVKASHLYDATSDSYFINSWLETG
ncbi:MAG: hypothetical protein PHV97_05715, partial [Candidatus Omnitrophica bacterium]|nr:hypothetical protein [Candidatus Omnitrophota bacterium]